MERNVPLPSMLRSIIEAACVMFPGQRWADIEEHVRRAWHSVAHDHAWEQVRDGARREWERRQSSGAGLP
jgi:hypothetical protein